jgi:enoyl-CoA hydratase
MISLSNFIIAKAGEMNIMKGNEAVWITGGAAMYQYFKVESTNNVCVVTLSNGSLNSLCNAMVTELDAFVTEFEQNLPAKVLIITGRGKKAFIAGADIRELKDRDRILARSQTKQRQGLYNRLASLPVPVIAAVNGFALGAGFELALACDIRIASEQAVFAAAEINFGIIPGNGGTQRLPRLVGLGRAIEMVLTGDRINAYPALEWGLVTHVYKDTELMPKAFELAELLAGKSRLALQYAKEAVLCSLNCSLSEGLLMESCLHALACASEDKGEGVAAFLEKRSPKYTGR